MKVKNIKTGEILECERRGDSLFVRATGRLLLWNPLMIEMEGDPAGGRWGLPNGGEGFILDEKFRPILPS